MCDTFTPGCAREALLPLWRTWAGERRACGPFLPHEEQSCLAPPGAHLQAGDRMTLPPVAPSATPWEPTLDWVALHSFIRQQIPTYEGSGWGSETLSIWPTDPRQPCGLCPDSTLESNCVWTGASCLRQTLH